MRAQSEPRPPIGAATVRERLLIGLSFGVVRELPETARDSRIHLAGPPHRDARFAEESRSGGAVRNLDCVRNWAHRGNVQRGRRHAAASAGGVAPRATPPRQFARRRRQSLPVRLAGLPGHGRCRQRPGRIRGLPAPRPDAGLRRRIGIGAGESRDTELFFAAGRARGTRAGVGGIGVGPPASSAGLQSLAAALRRRSQDRRQHGAAGSRGIPGGRGDRPGVRRAADAASIPKSG